MSRVVVVGGGASGLMAAGSAAECGAEVILLEKMDTVARKLRITGKGRCNLTNAAELPDFIKHFGHSGRFLRQCFGQFFSNELIDFFESRGLKLALERGGRYFPAKADAPAVARLLRNWCKKMGVHIDCGNKVEALIIADRQVVGVRSNGAEIAADRVILATGGRSYPQTGSTGDGYRLALSAGHTLTPLRPALVHLLPNDLDTRGLAGLNLRNVAAALLINGRKKDQKFGELAFVEAGLGGPIILSLSSRAVDALTAGSRVEISLDLKPALDHARLEARLLRDLSARARERISSVLRGLLPQELVLLCLDITEIVPDTVAAQLRAQERKRLRCWLKDFRIGIGGHGSFEQAIITSGGVHTREVDPYSMESRLVGGLFFSGELLDIQADTGGYNLQAAFSTGWVAGRGAAGQVRVGRVEPVVNP